MDCINRIMNKKIKVNLKVVYYMNLLAILYAGISIIRRILEGSFL